MQNFKLERIQKIRSFMANHYYDSVVKESCAMLEEILKKVYREATSILPIADRSVLMESEAKIGANRKGYNEFGFGELVGLFNRSRLLERLDKYSETNMGIIRSISLDYIVDLRNKLTHNESKMSQPVSAAEAQLVLDCLLSWLDFIGYKETTPTSTPNQKKSAAPTAVYERVKKEITSGYNSDIKEERRRLKKQAKYSEKHDAISFEYALSHIQNKDHLVGLDIGCASGYVTELRFKDEYHFDKVIGVDFNKDIIERTSQEDHGIFKYHFANVEDRHFNETMEDIMEEEGIEDGFDVIFCALVLHHLKNPLRAIMRMRKLLKKGGALIIRGVDDGAMLAYDDHGLVEKILNDCTRQDNASDRYHGRKYHPWLVEAGFKDIKMNYQVDDTTQMDVEEREDFFHYYFDFRLQYTLRPLNKEPNNPTFIKDHEIMCNNLEKLEELFMKPDFYFSTLTISCIAIK